MADFYIKKKISRGEVGIAEAITEHRQEFSSSELRRILSNGYRLRDGELKDLLRCYGDPCVLVKNLPEECKMLGSSGVLSAIPGLAYMPHQARRGLYRSLQALFGKEDAFRSVIDSNMLSDLNRLVTVDELRGLKKRGCVFTDGDIKILAGKYPLKTLFKVFPDECRRVGIGFFSKVSLFHPSKKEHLKIMSMLWPAEDIMMNEVGDNVLDTGEAFLGCDYYRDFLDILKPDVASANKLLNMALSRYSSSNLDITHFIFTIGDVLRRQIGGVAAIDFMKSLPDSAKEIVGKTFSDGDLYHSYDFVQGFLRSPEVLPQYNVLIDDLGVFKSKKDYAEFLIRGGAFWNSVPLEVVFDMGFDYFYYSDHNVDGGVRCNVSDIVDKKMFTSASIEAIEKSGVLERLVVATRGARRDMVEASDKKLLVSELKKFIRSGEDYSLTDLLSLDIGEIPTKEIIKSGKLTGGRFLHGGVRDGKKEGMALLGVLTLEEVIKCMDIRWSARLFELGLIKTADVIPHMSVINERCLPYFEIPDIDEIIALSKEAKCEESPPEIINALGFEYNLSRPHSFHKLTSSGFTIEEIKKMAERYADLPTTSPADFLKRLVFLGYPDNFIFDVFENSRFEVRGIKEYMESEKDRRRKKGEDAAGVARRKLAKLRRTSAKVKRPMDGVSHDKQVMNLPQK